MLHTLERSIQHQPRDYVSISTGKEGASEKIGTHVTDIDQLLVGSGILKNKRTTYNPIEEFDVKVNTDFSPCIKFANRK